MKKLFQFRSALICALTSVSIAYAAIPSNNHPTTFLGPILKGSMTNTATNTMAYSVLGEIGTKNLRVGGTLGWQLDSSQFVKVSADYLRQDITYTFISGNTDQWVSQGSIGAGYLYDFFQCQYDPQVNLNGYVSHAPSKSLNSTTASFINAAGVAQSFTDNRRIAGSTAGGISPGVSIAPWINGRVGFELNYDNVQYNKKNSPNRDAIGLGGTIKLSQAILDNVMFNVSAAVRSPFNNYEAEILWNNLSYNGLWNLGLFGDYNVGKNTLPNSYNVGVTVNYTLDCPVPKNRSCPVRTNLHSFTSTPAVYLPQVLAIADERPGCSPQITLIGTIPTLDDSVSTTFNAASVFSPSSGLTYSIAVSPSPTPPGSVTINPTTGVITLVSGAVTESLTAIVTARNACGSVSSNTFTIILND